MGEHAADLSERVGMEGEEALPRQFGKYTLLRRLAAGGMAELFLALHRSMAGFEKLVVIKRILPAMNQDRAFIEMLLHEARIAATLSHPNIVQIFDVGHIEGSYFIAMEHIHGEDIRSIVRGMRRKGVSEFPLEHALSVVVGMCAGLAYAHEKRDLDGRLLDIVHRDISPQNIVVAFTGDVKIVDFGIAKSGAQVGEDTKDGQLKGKVPYMSPEQARGEDIDRRSDIFAVGVMLFELTTGRRLFKGASEYETLQMICDRDYPRPSEVRPGYPPALDAIVMKALEKRPEDRYQSAREMQTDLEAFIREERIAVSQVSLSRWMERLFEEKLSQQKEVLQDIKQLADVLAAQQSSSMYEEPFGSKTGTTAGSGIVAVPARRRQGALVAGAAAVLLLAAGLFILRKQDAAPAEHGARAEASAAAAPAGPSAAAPKGWIEIASDPPGCAIWINGDLRKEVTPAKIEQLPLDREIQVKLTREGLEPHRESLTLTEQAPSRAVSAKMGVGSVTVQLKVNPPATVWLDGKPWKGKPDLIDGVTAGEEHKLVLSAKGYSPRVITFTAQPGETKTLEAQLPKAVPGRAADAATQPTADSTAADSTAADAAPADAAPADAAPADAAPASAAKVRVGAKGGFCSVVVNGAAVGPTPVEAPVMAGMVRIDCKPADGRSLSQTVHVSPGETARVSFKLD